MERDANTPARQDRFHSQGSQDFDHRRQHDDMDVAHFRPHDWQAAEHRAHQQQLTGPRTPHRSPSASRDNFDDHSQFYHNGYRHFSHSHHDEPIDSYSQFSNHSHISSQTTSRDEPVDSNSHSQLSNLSPYSNHSSFCRPSVSSSTFESLPTQSQTSIRSTCNIVSPSPISQNKKKYNSESTSTRTGRGTNFNRDELDQLCKSWLNVSEDAIVGSDQKSNTFWQKITDHFHEQLGVVKPEDKRTLKSIQSRWSSLNKSMARFAACVQQVKMIRETGKTIEDQFQDALTLYNTEVKTAFTHISCYNIVKHSAKWTDNPQYIEYCGRKRKASKHDDPGNQLVDLDAIPAVSSIGDIKLPVLDRPAGSKNSKRSQNANDDNSTSQIVANSTSTANATDCIASHLDRASSSLEAMLELSLLQTDTSNLNENVRAALEADKEALLLRRAARRRNAE